MGHLWREEKEGLLSSTFPPPLCTLRLLFDPPARRGELCLWPTCGSGNVREVCERDWGRLQSSPFWPPDRNERHRRGLMSRVGVSLWDVVFSRTVLSLCTERDVAWEDSTTEAPPAHPSRVGFGGAPHGRPTCSAFFFSCPTMYQLCGLTGKGSRAWTPAVSLRPQAGLHCPREKKKRIQL